MSELIIRDETEHLAFHRDRLALKMEGNCRLGVCWAAFMYLLAFAAGSMLWINHRKPLIALGATTAEFYRCFFNETRRFIHTTRNRRAGTFSPPQLRAQAH